MKQKLLNIFKELTIVLAVVLLILMTYLVILFSNEEMRVIAQTNTLGNFFIKDDGGVEKILQSIERQQDEKKVIIYR